MEHARADFQALLAELAAHSGTTPFEALRSIISGALTLDQPETSLYLLRCSSSKALQD